MSLYHIFIVHVSFPIYGPFFGFPYQQKSSLTKDDCDDDEENYNNDDGGGVIGDEEIFFPLFQGIQLMLTLVILNL